MISHLFRAPGDMICSFQAVFQATNVDTVLKTLLACSVEIGDFNLDHLI